VESELVRMFFVQISFLMFFALSFTLSLCVSLSLSLPRSFSLSLSLRGALSLPQEAVHVSAKFTSVPWLPLKGPHDSLLPFITGLSGTPSLPHRACCDIWVIAGFFTSTPQDTTSLRQQLTLVRVGLALLAHRTVPDFDSGVGTG